MAGVLAGHRRSISAWLSGGSCAGRGSNIETDSDAADRSGGVWRLWPDSLRSPGRKRPIGSGTDSCHGICPLTRAKMEGGQDAAAGPFPCPTARRANSCGAVAPACRGRLGRPDNRNRRPFPTAHVLKAGAATADLPSMTSCKKGACARWTETRSQDAGGNPHARYPCGPGRRASRERCSARAWARDRGD